MSSFDRDVVPRAIIFSVSAGSAACGPVACTLPAMTRPRTDTSGTVWFSTTSTTRPLARTVRTVRVANGTAGGAADESGVALPAGALAVRVADAPFATEAVGVGAAVAATGAD